MTVAAVPSVSAASTAPSQDSALADSASFVQRHIGPSPEEQREMLRTLGVASLEALMDQTIPADIRLAAPLRIGAPRSEHEALAALAQIAAKNTPLRSMIGMGYSDTHTPPPILRNILENPGWYTQYTPYQAEISQGRLEALLNFQTMVADLTGLPLANASLLDEATAAAEAMHLCRAACRDAESLDGFFVAEDCHPQTIAVIQTRARPLGIRIVVGPADSADFAKDRLFGAIVQYPTTFGEIHSYSGLAQRAHDAGALLVVATDLLALTLLKPPGEWGADIAVGSSQRFGVPLGGGGPHAAFISCAESHKRSLPGRIIGVSKDSHGAPALRLAIQTREQHIRREKATSNICTAQVLLAVMAGMYAVYHGPRGLERIARRVQRLTAAMIVGLERLGHETLGATPVFDTLRVRLRAGVAAAQVFSAAEREGFLLRDIGDGTIGLSLDETTTTADVAAVLRAFAGDSRPPTDIGTLANEAVSRRLDSLGALTRHSAYLTHPVFSRYQSEHELLRYIKRLESRDLSLTTSMIPLGSCTMKLNAAAEMFPVSWPGFSRMHPFAPPRLQGGYAELYRTLEAWLAEVTGFPSISLQPNAGSQGEYAGLLVIRAYHESRGDGRRDVCLIPVSAHGTNPASAVMAGFRVVPVACDALGNVDLADLRAKAHAHAQTLGALMITYPSTHGVFETQVREICGVVHEHGGQVYMDGANMNAQVGLTRPADIGADVCHLNLHKTFCIPHGGGGPGMGPIGVAAHLAPFLPGHPVAGAHFHRPAGDAAGAKSIGPVSAAPFGSPSILVISWMYIAMMGELGLRRATQVAILNANYMARRLEEHYPIVYRGAGGRVAHEFILDVRAFDESAGIRPEDIAKRLMDYGFHAPTMSWPVPGSLMIEPTESESRAELDRLCDALIAIREEIREIESGRADRSDNVLRNAPHTAAHVCADDWRHPYSREKAAYPAPWTREHKFWPAVGRVDNVWGDRNLFCTCESVEQVASMQRG
ncbi:MAG: aminomethyl-transferring glycine dehydrogenase [Planctomycetia bacterium]|nr:MAG: aminomethyl-transferring glycine dehydrogenase [Planctomycetia bacterium]